VEGAIEAIRTDSAKLSFVWHPFQFEGKIEIVYVLNPLEEGG
jgi:hypothetical protein